MCTMQKAQDILSKSHQHVRDLVLEHKRVREYVYNSRCILYNIADLEKERLRQLEG